MNQWIPLYFRHGFLVSQPRRGIPKDMTGTHRCKLTIVVVPLIFQAALP